MTELTFDQELRQRDPRFLRVVETDADKGQGVYELRTATGATARATFTFDGTRIMTPFFDEATRARLAAAALQSPDSYADGLKKLKAAAATPETTFEHDFRAARMAQAAATRRALDGEVRS